jgi:protoporphyrinogen/coproporphyrinogen III oxidase
MPHQTEQFDLVIIGGGPAGLAHAFWRLRECPDLNVLILEAAHRTGGWVETKTIDGYQIEIGPQGFRPDDSVDLFLQATHLTDSVIDCADSAKKRFLMRGGRLHLLPSKPGALLRSRLASLPAKIRLMLEPRVRSKSAPRESVAGFVTRRFGKAAAPLAEAMMHGIYAGNAHDLEVAATLPAVLRLENQHGSILRGLGARRREQIALGTSPRPSVCTFQGGMQESIDTLEKTLGDRIKTNAPVRSVTGSPGDFTISMAPNTTGVPTTVHSSEVCITTPPQATASMLRDLDEPLARVLDQIPSASVASTYLGFESMGAIDHVDGFGCLAPQGESGPVLGAIFCSSVFPQQAPIGHVLFRVMSGGVAYPQEVDRDEDDLVQQAFRVLQQYVGIKRPPDFRYVSRARCAIPQYVEGHTERMRTISERLTPHRGLTLRGAAYEKVSVIGQWAEAGSKP